MHKMRSRIMFTRTGSFNQIRRTVLKFQVSISSSVMFVQIRSKTKYLHACFKSTLNDDELFVGVIFNKAI